MHNFNEFHDQWLDEIQRDGAVRRNNIAGYAAAVVLSRHHVPLWYMCPADLRPTEDDTRLPAFLHWLGTVGNDVPQPPAPGGVVDWQEIRFDRLDGNVGIGNVR